MSVIGRRRVADFHAGKLAQLHGLLRDRVDAGDHGLRGDDGRGDREEKQRQARPAGRPCIEKVFECVRVAHVDCSLPQILEHERRKTHIEPCIADRLLAEMSHVRVERFASGHGQHDRAQ